MIESPFWARGHVNYDGIVALRKQEQFIKKHTGRDNRLKAQTLTGCCQNSLLRYDPNI